MNPPFRSLQSVVLRGPLPLRWLAVNGFGWILRRRRFFGAFQRHLAFLLESQWWSPEQLERFQEERLRAVVTGAARDVPYYAELFRDRGIDPAECDLAGLLADLPVLTKRDIRREAERLLSRARRRGHYVPWSTSGTTGEKVSFLLPRELVYAMNAATVWRHYAWAGVSLEERRATLGGRLFTAREPFWIRNYAEHQLLLSIHHLDEGTAPSYRLALERFRPGFLQGHPSGISFLARTCGAGLSRLGLKAVVTTGESLSADDEVAIADAFGCLVLQEYGQGECVVRAQTCRTGGSFHALAEYGIIEHVRFSADGPHEVVGTSLWNDVMPFIRYRIEDEVEPAAASRCTCGRGLPLTFSRVTGRADDCLYGVDGGRLWGVTMRMAMKPLLEPFESYQIIQHGRAEFEVIVTSPCDHTRAEQLRGALRERLGIGASILVGQGALVRTPGGKTRSIIRLHAR